MATVPTADPAEAILELILHGRSPGDRPFVTLAYAQSLDGSLAARRGEPLAISGSASHKLTHQLRASHSAILVGIGTILADDPQLSVRLVSGKNPQPVILDSRLRTPPQARVFQSKFPWVASTLPVEPDRAVALETCGAKLFVFPAGSDGRVQLPLLLSCLAGQGIKHLMVEGGAAVITSFLREELVDLLVLTIAPILVGGQPGIESLLGGGSSFPLRFPHLEEMNINRLGDDLIVWGHPHRQG